MALHAAAFLFTLCSLTAPPSTFPLTTDMGVWDVATGDINGDGRMDIAALCSDNKTSPLRKCVAFFLASGDGQFPSSPSFSLPLSPATGSVFFAETDGTPPRELVAADAAGATIYTFREGSFSATATPRFYTLLPSGSKEPLFLNDAATDLNGDGIDEWLLPVPMAYEVRTPERALATIPCDIVSQAQDGDALSISHQVPACQAFAYGQSSTKGLAFLSDEYADFATGTDWTTRRRFKIPLNLEDKWITHTQMADIDGNGLPDLIVTQAKGTLNLQVLMHVYLAQGIAQYPSTPTASFEAKGAIARPMLKDFDGDGKLDILIVKVPFGLMSITNYFLRQKVTTQVDAYRFNGTGFGAQPDRSESITVDAPEGREQIAYTMGDFNGDGRMDAAFGAGAGKLLVYMGTPDRLLSSVPTLTVSVNAFGVARPCRLAGKAHDDLIIFHPGVEARNRMDVIIF